MYFQPYGDEQQLNLNWIINEIINLHKQLDPDYETPSFTQIYPYSNLNRLNLDWILSELKALKELAPEPTPALDIQAVAEALVALPFDSNASYQIYDFISKDGEIWRATEAIPAGGEWDSTQWFKTTLGQDLAVLERWINTINNSLSGEIEARQNADTTLQTNIDNEALARQQADTALQTHIDNEALARQQADTSLQNAISGLTSANISDDSDAGGATVKASLNNLKGSLNLLENIEDISSLITITKDASQPGDITNEAHHAYRIGKVVFLSIEFTHPEADIVPGSNTPCLQFTVGGLHMKSGLYPISYCAAGSTLYVSNMSTSTGNLRVYNLINNSSSSHEVYLTFTILEE